MKLIFIDEFKPASKLNGKKLFGISAILIDATHYANYKKGFEEAFMKLGWAKEKELKGRYTYSKAVFENITVEQRITFAEDLFKLSSSVSGKSKRISVFVCFDYFTDTQGEHDIYIDLLSRILKKIGSPSSAKSGKNLIAFFLDNNDSVTKKISESEFYSLTTATMNRDWIIFEKPFFITSSSLCPGLVFADFVSYFHQNFIDTKKFFSATKSRFSELLNKKEIHLTGKEKNELNSYITNYEKQKKSSRVIRILKGVVYV